MKIGFILFGFLMSLSASAGPRGFVASGRSITSFESAQDSAKRSADARCHGNSKRIGAWELTRDMNYDDSSCEDMPRGCAPRMTPEFTAVARFICR